MIHMKNLTLLNKTKTVFAKSPLNKLTSKKARPFVFILVFGVLGSLTLLAIRAAGEYASVEPEAGTLTGSISQITDTTASNGKAIKFGASTTPTPTPTPTPPAPTPGPTPSRTTNCLSQPSACGYPDATNTGYRGTLTDLGGMIDVLDANVVVAGTTYTYPATGTKIVRTGVVLEPGKVTLSQVRMTRLRNRSSNVRVTGDNVAIIMPAGSTGANYTVDATQSNGTAFIELRDCTVYASQVNVAVAWKNFSVTRCDVSGGLDAVRLGSNTTVIDSYLHNLERLPGSHNDILQIIGGQDATVRHCTMLAYNGTTGAGLAGGDPMNAILQIGNLSGNITNVTVENNLVNGGNYSFNANWLNVDAGLHTASDINIRNNRIGRDYRYGVKSNMRSTIVNWSSNVWDDTGAAIN